MSDIVSMLNEVLNRPVGVRRLKRVQIAGTMFCVLVSLAASILGVVLRNDVLSTSFAIGFDSLALCFIVWFMAITMQDD